MKPDHTNRTIARVFCIAGAFLVGLGLGCIQVNGLVTYWLCTFGFFLALFTAHHTFSEGE